MPHAFLFTVYGIIVSYPSPPPHKLRGQCTYSPLHLILLLLLLRCRSGERLCLFSSKILCKLYRSNPWFYLLRKVYPGVCEGIFFDEAASSGMTNADGTLTDIGQHYYDYNEAALAVVRGYSKLFQSKLGGLLPHFYSGTR